MTWTEITRAKYRRDAARYASDLTDVEWTLVVPLLPPSLPLGRPCTTSLRSVVDAILYIASTGCQWRQLPKEFPPYSAVQGYFYRWSRQGVFASINHLLVMAAREAPGARRPYASFSNRLCLLEPQAGSARRPVSSTANR